MSVSTLAGLVHSFIDHHGRRTFEAWVYDTSRPRNLSRIEGRYAAVTMLGVYRTRDKAEKAFARRGIAMLTDTA